MVVQRSDNAKKGIALSVLAENFGRDFSDDLLRLWLDLLAPYSAEQVQAAVKAVISGYVYKTLPPFAVLKAALDDVSGTGEKALELQALSEWGKLLDAFAKQGSRHKPPLHPTTDYVLHCLGGWETACQWTYRELDFKRRDFLRYWTEAHGRLDILALGADAVCASVAALVDRLALSAKA
jgi:hypothetical protein